VFGLRFDSDIEQRFSANLNELSPNLLNQFETAPQLPTYLTIYLSFNSINVFAALKQLLDHSDLCNAALKSLECQWLIYALPSPYLPVVLALDRNLIDNGLQGDCSKS
jgi:hypothetical protein